VKQPFSLLKNQWFSVDYKKTMVIFTNYSGVIYLQSYV